MALASMDASQARARPWVAGAAGFVAGAAIGAAANASYHYGSGYYYGPDYYYGPSYSAGYYDYGPGYYYDSPGYASYAYYDAPVAVAAPVPAYPYRYHRGAYRAHDPAYAYTGDPAYAPAYPGYPYNSPWQERRLEGVDY